MQQNCEGICDFLNYNINPRQ